jgi:hypothetical protein
MVASVRRIQAMALGLTMGLTVVPAASEDGGADEKRGCSISHPGTGSRFARATAISKSTMTTAASFGTSP